MKKYLIVMTAVLVSSLLMIGCTQTPTPQSTGTAGNEKPTVAATAEAMENIEPTEPVAKDKHIYVQYVQARADMLARLSSLLEMASTGNWSPFYRVMEVATLDAAMWPSAILWQSEEELDGIARDLYGVADLSVQKSGNTTILSIREEGGKLIEFHSTPREDGAPGYLFVLKYDGVDRLYFDFTMTMYGFVGQYYLPDNDMGVSRFVVTVTFDSSYGTIGLEEETGPYEPLSGRQPADFGKTMPEWYSLDGNRLLGISSDGSTIDYREP